MLVLFPIGFTYLPFYSALGIFYFLYFSKNNKNVEKKIKTKYLHLFTFLDAVFRNGKNFTKRTISLSKSLPSSRI